MRRVIFIIILLGILLSLFAFSALRKKVSRDFSQPGKSGPPSISPSPTGMPIREGSERTSLFVPYWSLAEDIPDSYDKVIYFGVTPTTSGINTNELGYKRIDAFLKAAPPSVEKILALRMLDSKVNFEIIESEKNREAVIDETFETAQENGFSGVLLDLEISAIPFESVTKNISTFISEFSDVAKTRDLKFSVAIYGDTFYRVRPFDLKLIGSKADEVMIMAYDLHKARGNPGPNFPLSGKDTFGYDFETMIGDFSEKVSPSKLTVIFGMFGYDWEVNDSDKAAGTGKSLAYIDGKKLFIDTCSFRTCEWYRDEQSGEITVTYIDEDDKKHIVWFEDPTSVARKEDFLKKRGISSYSLWAHSYF
jgi:spore germination protein YaaH